MGVTSFFQSRISAGDFEKHHQVASHRGIELQTWIEAPTASWESLIFGYSISNKRPDTYKFLSFDVYPLMLEVVGADGVPAEKNRESISAGTSLEWGCISIRDYRAELLPGHSIVVLCPFLGVFRCKNPARAKIRATWNPCLNTSPQPGQMTTSIFLPSAPTVIPPPRSIPAPFEGNLSAHGPFSIAEFRTLAATGNRVYPVPFQSMPTPQPSKMHIIIIVIGICGALGALALFRLRKSKVRKSTSAGLVP